MTGRRRRARRRLPGTFYRVPGAWPFRHHFIGVAVAISGVPAASRNDNWPWLAISARIQATGKAVAPRLWQLEKPRPTTGWRSRPRRRRARMLKRSFLALSLCTVAGTTFAACSTAQSQSPPGKDKAAKEITVEAVHQASVRRSLDVVATLAAADEVVVSSEADGVVRRIFADLGDRVTAGQVLVELDREKPAYGYDQQKAALARALARYGGTDLDHLPESRARRPTCSGPPPSSTRPAGVRARGRAAQASADSQPDPRRRAGRPCAPGKPITTRRCRT